MSRFCLIEAVEMEGFGNGGVVAPAFRDVQVAGVFDGRDDGGADGGQVGGPAAGPAGGSVFAERRVPYVLQGRVWPLHPVALTRHGWRLAADLLGCGARGW